MLCYVYVIFINAHLAGFQCDRKGLRTLNKVLSAEPFARTQRECAESIYRPHATVAMNCSPLSLPATSLDECVLVCFNSPDGVVVRSFPLCDSLRLTLASVTPADGSRVLLG